MLLAGIAVIAVLFIMFRTRPAGRMSSLQVSEEEYQDILQSHRISEDDILNGLWLNGRPTQFDRAAGTFYCSLQKDDPDAYDPSVTMDGTGVKMAVLSEPINEQFTSQNGTVHLLAYTNKICREYSLKLTTLPIMNIVSEKEISKNFPVTFTMEFYDNRAEAPVYYSSSIGTIHLRGASSLMYPKQSFKINLKSSVGKTEARDPNLLGMRENSDWILYAPYAERDCVRNVFSAMMWNRSCAEQNEFGIQNGYEYRYVELFLNGRYHGLYALGYMPDDVQLQAEESSGDIIYKNFDWFDYRNDIGRADEMFRIVNAYEGFSGLSIRDDWEPLRMYVSALNSHLPEEELWSLTDRESYMDLCLFANVSQGYDCAKTGEDKRVKNFFLTARQQSGNWKMMFTPWDLDLTWGKHFHDYVLDVTENNNYGFGPYGEYPPEEDPKRYAELCLQYRNLRKNGWSDEALIEIIDECEAGIFGSGAYARDKERWPESDLLEGQSDLSEFKSYVTKRMAYCDEYYAGN